MENIELTPEQEITVTKVAGSIIGKICLGAAIGLKGAGYALEKTTGLTAVGLRIAADGIETVGDVGSTFCYTNSSRLSDKAKEYDLSDLSNIGMKKTAAPKPKSETSRQESCIEADAAEPSIA